MKDSEEVRPDGKAVFYAVLYNSFREAALKCGYALALHGSMVTDMDMIAVPWTSNAEPVETLVKAISECIGQTVWKNHHLRLADTRPHNRLIYTLSISGTWYIDLSIMKPVDLPISEEKQQEVDKYLADFEQSNRQFPDELFKPKE